MESFEAGFLGRSSLASMSDITWSSLIFRCKHAGVNQNRDKLNRRFMPSNPTSVDIIEISNHHVSRHRCSGWDMANPLD
jgi:hypothetical protein